MLRHILDEDELPYYMLSFFLSLEHMWRLQQHNTHRLAAFLDMLSMCWLNLKLLSIIIPK